MTARHASGLGKRYRQRWALSDCTLQIPEGRPVSQPARRYWTFQWLEAGICLTVAIPLAWACSWWVRRLS
jgi:hypothetical protein